MRWNDKCTIKDCKAKTSQRKQDESTLEELLGAQTPNQNGQRKRKANNDSSGSSYQKRVKVEPEVIVIE